LETTFPSSRFSVFCQLTEASYGPKRLAHPQIWRICEQQFALLLQEMFLLLVMAEEEEEDSCTKTAWLSLKIHLHEI
jgi:hypothetical protein